MFGKRKTVRNLLFPDCLLLGDERTRSPFVFVLFFLNVALRYEEVKDRMFLPLEEPRILDDEGSLKCAGKEATCGVSVCFVVSSVFSLARLDQKGIDIFKEAKIDLDEQRKEQETRASQQRPLPEALEMFTRFDKRHWCSGQEPSKSGVGYTRIHQVRGRKV